MSKYSSCTWSSKTLSRATARILMLSVFLQKQQLSFRITSSSTDAASIASTAYTVPTKVIIVILQNIFMSSQVC